MVMKAQSLLPAKVALEVRAFRAAILYDIPTRRLCFNVLCHIHSFNIPVSGAWCIEVLSSAPEQLFCPWSQLGFNVSHAPCKCVVARLEKRDYCHVSTFGRTLIVVDSRQASSSISPNILSSIPALAPAFFKFKAEKRASRR